MLLFCLFHLPPAVSLFPSLLSLSLSHSRSFPLTLLAGAMFQKYEMSTGSIQLLQEVTDKAVDAAATPPTSRPSLSRHAKSAADAAVSAAEAAEAGNGGAPPAAAGEGLADWRLLRVQLDRPGLAGRLEQAVRPCGGLALSKHPLEKQVTRGMWAWHDGCMMWWLHDVMWWLHDVVIA